MLVKKDGFEFICSLNQYELHQFILQSLTEYYDEKDIVSTDDYLYAKGSSVMFVAHLDTVHTKKATDFWYSSDGDKVMALNQGIGGDDRCGVYTLLYLIKYLDVKPTVIFPHEEERGCIGTKKFVEDVNKDFLSHVKFMVEIDRKGNEDAVFYRCDNKEFKDMILEKTEFVEKTGSSSDIAYLSPKFDLAAVNLSSGYYKPHNIEEYVSFKDLENVIKKCIILHEYGNTDECIRYDFQEQKPISYSDNDYSYCYSNGNYYMYGSKSKNVIDITESTCKVDVGTTQDIIDKIIKEYESLNDKELDKKFEDYKKKFIVK